VEITHPFHPLRGQRFAVLKTKRHADLQILFLHGTSRGTFGFPLDWTDRAPPLPGTILEAEALLRLAELVRRLAEPGGLDGTRKEE
jgi:hypothetical protein